MCLFFFSKVTLLFKIYSRLNNYTQEKSQKVDPNGGLIHVILISLKSLFFADKRNISARKYKVLSKSYCCFLDIYIDNKKYDFQSVVKILW